MRIGERQPKERETMENTERDVTLSGVGVETRVAQYYYASR